MSSDRMRAVAAHFDERIDREAVIRRGQTEEAAGRAFDLARALELYGGSSSITGDALNAYWRTVEADA